MDADKIFNEFRLKYEIFLVIYFKQILSVSKILKINQNLDYLVYYYKKCLNYIIYNK